MPGQSSRLTLCVGMLALVLVFVLELGTAPAPTSGATMLHVPAEYSTIQAAIDAAQHGAVILVAPGTYREALLLAGKQVTLASEWLHSGDADTIERTVIDGAGAEAVIRVEESASGSTIIGFTIQNGVDGLKLLAPAVVHHNRVQRTTDGIDSTGGGGVIRDNVFEHNADDGIDFDQHSAGLIEGNIIRNNANDGIEIRLHPYTGPTLNVTIRGNQISGNLEDGIQLIDYPDLSDRVLRIERNLIRDNTDVGIGLMDDGETNEDFRGAGIPERIYVFNNTVIDNPYGLTGGANLVALNNIFAGATVLALKNVTGRSVAAYNLFSNNGADAENSNVVENTTIHADPLLDDTGRLSPGSPAVDTGIDRYVHNNELVLSYAGSSYAGTAPDLGWHEQGFAGPLPLGTQLFLPLVVRSDPEI